MITLLQSDARRTLKSLLVLALLFAVGTYAQSGERPTKEERRRAEQERKEREKHLKEYANRQKEEERSKALLEKLVPIGKQVDYDRFKDITTVNTYGMTLYPMDRALRRDVPFYSAYVGMWALYSIKGQFGSPPPTVRFYLHGQTALIGTPNNPCSLSMILSGSGRVQFGQMEYGRTLQLGNIAWVDMSLSSFRAVANSRSVELQTCRFEMKLTPRHISGLAALLEGVPAATNDGNGSSSSTAVEALHPHVGSWRFQVAQSGKAEEWVLRIEKNGDGLIGNVKSPTAEINLRNIISSGNTFIGGASEIVADGMNTLMFSGQVSGDLMSGKLTIYLAGQQQPIIPFEARRFSIP